MYARCMVLTTVLILAASASANAGDPFFGIVQSHNGLLTSFPPGTGEVDVDFAAVGLTLGPHRGDYNEIATHRVDYMYDPGTSPVLRMFAAAFIVNSTGIPWSGFRIRLEGADFAGHGSTTSPLSAPSSNPVVDVGLSGAGFGDLGPQFMAIRHNIPNNFTLDSSSILRTGDVGSGFTNAELNVVFGDPFLNGAFHLLYHVIPSPGSAGNTSFSMFLTPIPVPEPATAALLGVGVLGCIRKRHGV